MVNSTTRKYDPVAFICALQFHPKSLDVRAQIIILVRELKTGPYYRGNINTFHYYKFRNYCLV